MPRRMLAGITAILFGVSPVFTLSASAHNVSITTAKAKVSRYAQRIVNARNNRYISAATECARAFNGHNHYARCTVRYKDKATEGRSTAFACVEQIEVFFQSHNLVRGENNTYYMRHTSRACGDTVLSN